MNSVRHFNIVVKLLIIYCGNLTVETRFLRFPSNEINKFILVMNRIESTVPIW